MSPILERKLRFSDAVVAIDTRPKVLRNWLQRDQVQFINDDRSGGWREFNVVDIAVLAIMRKLVDFGMPVSDANFWANETVIVRTADRLDNSGPQFAALAALFEDYIIAAYKYGDMWRVSRVPYANLKEIPADAYLVVDVRSVVGAALDRLSEVVDGQ